MRRTELQAAIGAKKATGLDRLNDSLMTAKRIAEAVERAPKVRIDQRDMMEAVRNFTKVIDGLYQHNGAMTYALVEYVDDATEEHDAG